VKATAALSRPQVGDLVVIEAHRVGEPKRYGEILEILGAGEHEHYRMRWDDGHESVYYPSSDASLQHVEHLG
jgi:hypothetical protein